MDRELSKLVSESQLNYRRGKYLRVLRRLLGTAPRHGNALELWSHEHKNGNKKEHSKKIPIP